MNTTLKQMLEINQQQRVYYDNASGSAEAAINSGATNLWRRSRGRLFAGINARAVLDSVTALHREWMGDLSKRKVLDLGVGTGNPLSIELARRSGEYVAIDLSPNRISDFRAKLDGQGITQGKLYAADFLNRTEFPEGGFDVVYAMSVFHHFQHFGAFLDELKNRMSPSGIVITLDPLQTWLPARLVRMAYRPLQTDRAWEWPFTRAGLRVIESRFQIDRVQGMYARSKWALPLALFSPELARRKAQEWHARDLQDRNSLDRIGSCLQLSLRLCAKK
jgi:2-polyprenyl-3-methyl-5-hydroxy-6-metoxy-1,4-benzoquinol methylase